MPGTNLTRDEAATRAKLLEVDSYDVALDLTGGPTRFASTTIIRFTCREPGASTFADLVDAEVHEVTLNGRSLDPSVVYADSRLALDGLESENELVVRADCAYTRTGEGLHRFVDPADDRVYTYTQFEVPDARRVYTTFEQPDLKSVFTFTVTAPAHWKVVSNAATPVPEPIEGTESAVWRFPTTERMSTYITAVVAGEYHEVMDSFEGRNGTISLGHYCRQSMVEHFDVDALVKVTKEGFEFFEAEFDYPYPFGKYDQLYVPEYNMGAMENAGCVTFRDEYLPRSRQSRAFFEMRANTILHELSHMWFGNLVTMRWWDDLWLNESFAEWASHHALVEATEYTDAWTSFTNARKNWAYRQDQLPSTHPIAADNYDLHAVEVNFDGITYAKGASTLKQLVAWVGLEPFMAGLRSYFKAHEFANTEFSDLLHALERASGRELDEWARLWLQTSGVNTLTPDFEVDDEGNFSSFVVRQSAEDSAGADNTLRPHRIGIGLYDLAGDALSLRERFEVDVEGASTLVDELVGCRQPDLVLLNDGDLTYAKIRLDERSLNTVVANLSRIPDSLARALIWSAAWDMTRDGEMAASDYVRLVLASLGDESDPVAVGRTPGYAKQAVMQYAAPEHRDALRQEWEDGLWDLLNNAAAGSDHQLSFARAYASAARSEVGLDRLQALIDGEQTLPGLVVDTDLRWALLIGLAAGGRADEARIAAELDNDNTISGQESAAMARAVRPTAEAKAEAWHQLAERDDVPNETLRQIALGFPTAGQEALLEPYLDRYLEAAQGLWDRLGTHRGSVVLEYAFPVLVMSPDNVTKVTQWLETSSATPAVKRYVREGLAEMQRGLTAQECDRNRS